MSIYNTNNELILKLSKIKVPNSYWMNRSIFIILLTRKNTAAKINQLQNMIQLICKVAIK